MILLRLPIALFLLVLQSAMLATGQIWSNKTRSVLTTIGIVIGVSSVTAVIAALTGLRGRPGPPALPVTKRPLASRSLDDVSDMGAFSFMERTIPVVASRPYYGHWPL